MAEKGIVQWNAVGDSHQLSIGGLSLLEARDLVQMANEKGIFSLVVRSERPMVQVHTGHAELVSCELLGSSYMAVFTVKDGAVTRERIDQSTETECIRCGNDLSGVWTQSTQRGPITERRCSSCNTLVERSVRIQNETDLLEFEFRENSELERTFEPSTGNLPIP